MGITTILDPKNRVAFQPQAYRSGVRCYTTSPYSSKVLMLTRIKTHPLASLDEAGRIINHWQINQPEYNPDRLKVLLGVERAALPRNLREQLQRSDHYQDFCETVVFCESLYLKRVNSFKLPSFIADESELTTIPCPGFPVTRPVEPNQVRISDADSVTDKEIDNMFGPLAQFAGRMMVLSLGRYPDQLFPLQEIKTAADTFLRKLAGV